MINTSSFYLCRPTHPVDAKTESTNRNSFGTVAKRVRGTTTTKPTFLHQNTTSPQANKPPVNTATMGRRMGVQV
jgi:hypothetical protein